MRSVFDIALWVFCFMENNKRWEFKSTCSLVVIPPPEQWPQFIEIKKNHMNPKIKRPPYPHVTIIPKFSTDQDMLDEAERVCSSISPFQLEMKELKMFNNATSHTLYLDPVEVGSDDPYCSLDNLHKNLAKSFNWKSKGAFSAHIGIAFSKKESEVRDWHKKYTALWKPCKFDVTHLYVMKRLSDTDPFEPVAAIPLKGHSKNENLQHKLAKK